MSDITAELLLSAYARGVFPMADSREADEVFWVDPRRRGVLPLTGFHVSRSLARRMRRGDYSVSLNQDFPGVLDACADRPETWINAEIRALYLDLHARGFAHSLEIGRDGRLIGGVYGVALNAAFFGESMFSRATDASKLALAHLTDHLAARGFTLFDTQFLTPHLASLGAIEIGRAVYHRRLAEALRKPATFAPDARLATPQEVMQRNTQTS
jgi:leucyl/phenylalanyl-tRNA--protein transferase